MTPNQQDLEEAAYWESILDELEGHEPDDDELDIPPPQYETLPPEDDLLSPGIPHDDDDDLEWEDRL